MKKYNVVPMLVDARGATVPSGCNDITFINFGDKLNPPAGDNLIVDDVVTIKPGQQYRITGNDGEMNVTVHRCRWEGVTGIRYGVVARKTYV